MVAAVRPPCLAAERHQWHSHLPDAWMRDLRSYKAAIKVSGVGPRQARRAGHLPGRSLIVGATSFPWRRRGAPDPRASERRLG